MSDDMLFNAEDKDGDELQIVAGGYYSSAGVMLSVGASGSYDRKAVELSPAQLRELRDFINERLGS